MARDIETFDAVVIGAGFGGLGAAVELAESGARILMLEALNYPGGCASTFSRDGYRFEAGATLFSGFGEGQLMRTWIDRHQLSVEVDWLDPIIELRTSDFSLAVPPDRDALVDAFAAFEPSRRPALQRFFERQRRAADTLWELFDDPELLPPLTLPSLIRHAARSPRYLPLLPLMNKSMMEVVAQEGLGDFEPLRIYLDALCQITVQVSADRAEAPFALAATDYCFRGTAHVRGGVGVLAHGLCDAVTSLGGEVRLADRVKALRRDGGGWLVTSRRGTVRTTLVVANLLPQNLRAMVTPAEGGALRRLDALASRVEEGWGAAMLYLGIDADAPHRPGAHHLELVADPQAPFVAGNHIFCSISDARETDRAPAGQRTVTVSTHVDMKALRQSHDPGAFIHDIQARMRDTLARLAPELHRGITHEMTASPRTFERFTRRAHGYVGGIPRTKGLDQYKGIFPAPVMPGLYLVGDSAFPGQSTLATAIGGARTARAALST